MATADAIRALIEQNAKLTAAVEANQAAIIAAMAASSALPSLFVSMAIKPYATVTLSGDGADDELFPHIHGGIHPDAVLEVHRVMRGTDGTFLSIEGVTTR